MLGTKMWRGVFSRFQKRAVPLTGAPPVRRQKSYSAQSGYVYQYHYEGHRPLTPGNGTEYVFEVCADRKPPAPVSVHVHDEALESWERERGRSLSQTERYAIAKMALFQAFDERESPAALGEPVALGADHVKAFLNDLDID